MNPAALIAFMTVDLLLVLTPGADWAFAMAAGLRGRAIGASVTGLAGGYVAHAALVTAGAGALIANSAAAVNALTLVGAAYLAWLGIGAARHPARATADDQAAVSRPRAALRGAAVSGLNPKGLLLFFAVLPQFVSAHAAWPPAAQLAVLGAGHVLDCVVIYLAVAIAARRILGARPHASQIAARVSGVLMIAIAIALTVERALVA